MKNRNLTFATTVVAVMILVGSIVLSSCKKREPAVCGTVLGLMEYTHNNGVGRDTVIFVGELGDTESFCVTHTYFGWDRGYDDSECDIFAGGTQYHKTEEIIGDWGGIGISYKIGSKNNIRTTDTTWEGFVHINYGEGEVGFSGLATIDANGNFIEKPFGDTLMFVRGDTNYSNYYGFLHADSVEVVRGVGVVSYFRIINHSKYRLIRENK